MYLFCLKHKPHSQYPKCNLYNSKWLDLLECGSVYEITNSAIVSLKMSWYIILLKQTSFKELVALKKERILYTVKHRL